MVQPQVIIDLDYLPDYLSVLYDWLYIFYLDLFCDIPDIPEFIRHRIFNESIGGISAYPKEPKQNKFS